MARRALMSLALWAMTVVGGACGVAPAVADPQPFAAWLADLRQEAVNDGIPAATVDQALQGLQPIPRVLELDRQQPEFTLTLADYLSRVVSPERVARGRQMLQENRSLLNAVGKAYHVQPRFIVALWGIESGYGHATGGFNVIASLATLAYDGRRSAYFRSELLDALKIIDQDKIAPEAMTGSWAGAMGQCQFMPSSFLRYAVDFDGDGRRDLWHSKADVLASAANYLGQFGWRDDETWGRPVRIPARFDMAKADPKVEKSVADWRAEGLRRIDGGVLPARAGLTGSLLLPEAGGSSAYLVYSNFRAILKWNRSNFFGIAVGTLADRIADQ